jgi:hypothetical protein
MYISLPRQPTAKKGLVGVDSSDIRDRIEMATAGGASKARSTHFDLKDANQAHAWLRATTSAFGRTLIGPGMTIKRHKRFTESADEADREALWDFYTTIEGRDFTNLSDFYPFIAKLYRTAGQFRLFGQAAWELRRNGFDEVVSYDVVPGFIWPNCKSDGAFKDPPFYQVLSKSIVEPLELQPEDMVMFLHPDVGHRPFATDFEALATYALPTDIYLSTAMLSLLENWKTPLALYTLGIGATEETERTFKAQLDQLYKGAANFGKAAVVARGEVNLKTITPAMDDLPFSEGHDSLKDEIEGVSGVTGSKLGRTEELSRSNLRELRKDYWETTLQPLSKMLAGQLYVQVHQRIFGIREWVPVFNSPDFLTQVEKATVGMRGRQWGALATNEFRSFVYDMQAIPEDWANEDYLIPKNMIPRDAPAEGEEPVEEPDTDSDEPIRGDEIREGLVRELKQYASFYLNRLGGGRTREFETEYIPENLKSFIDDVLDGLGDDREAVKMAFDAAIRGAEDGK